MDAIKELKEEIEYIEEIERTMCHISLDAARVILTELVEAKKKIRCLEVANTNIRLRDAQDWVALQAEIAEHKAQLTTCRQEYDGLSKRIEQLQTELDKHRWIPVAERLPAMKQLILVDWGKRMSDGECFELLRWNGDWPAAKDIVRWKPIILAEGE